MDKKKKKKSKGKAKKGNTIIALVILLGIIVLAGIVVYSYFKKDTPTVKEGFIGVNFYYINPTANKWEKELHQIAQGENKVVLESVLNTLYDGPNNSTLTFSIPKAVRIEKAKLNINDENTVEITFSEEYNNISERERIICISSMVYTLTDLSFVDNVHFYVGDIEIMASDGSPFGVLNRSNTILDEELEPNFAKSLEITLYFPDEQMLGLVAERRTIQINPLQEPELYIVKAWIDGPTKEGLYAAIPAETKVNSVEKSNGICYVDFTSDFVTKFAGGSTAETMMVYSLVNTLTELDGIKKVQIWVDGNKLTESQSMFHMDLSKPIERDETLIVEE